MININNGLGWRQDLMHFRGSIIQQKWLTTAIVIILKDTIAQSNLDKWYKPFRKKVGKASVSEKLVGNN